MVKSYKHLIQYKNTNLYVNKLGEIFDIEQGRYLNPTISTVGYKIVKQQYVHRLIAQTFLENKNNYPHINHLDGDKTNNNVDNLEWCSALKNSQHSIEILNSESNKKGSRNITEEDYKYILYERFFKGESFLQISETVNQSEGSVGKYLKELAKKENVYDKLLKELERQKQSRLLQLKGRKVPERRILLLDKDTSIVLKEFKTFSEPAKLYAGSSRNINGIKRAIKRKTIYKNYKWDIKYL
jgi:hypothetical protein